MRRPVLQVLGPVGLLVGSEERRLGGPRERAVVGLLAAANGPVTPERIVDEVWGEKAPESALGSLQVAVSRLRGVLRMASVPDPIALTAGGYLLGDLEVDATAFSEAARAVGSFAPRQAVAAADAALARWRGTPYADLAQIPALAAEAARLTEDRLILLEARADALLQLGNAERVQAELAALVEEHPFRERLWRLQALALYRCDRQAEALAVLRRLRTALAEELGVDPSAATRALEQAVLEQDPALGAASGEPGPPRPSAPVVPSAGPALVGRAELTARLHAGLDAGGGVVILTGDAGIGKSALVRDLVDYAGAVGTRPLTGQCYETDASPAYWPWLPVLRPMVGEQAAPEVAALLGDPTAGEAVVDAGSSALRLFEAVASVLGSAGPLLVVIEDLHWADASSLRLLAYVAEALASAPVLFVLTARDVESRRHPALGACFAALARLGADRMRVPPLGPEALGDLVRPLVGRSDADLLEVIARRTDGNPFFALQLVRVLSAQGDVTADAARALRVPEGIADVLRLRLLQLTSPARDALATAAVAGREVDADVLREALGRDPVDDLDEAVRAGLLEDGDRPGRYRFVHALARETVYADEPSGRRARRHAALAATLVPRLEHDPDLVAVVANHYAEAAAFAPELLPEAYGVQVRAARDAERRGAFDEAHGAWERAHDLERALRPPDPARRHALLLALATARQRTGDMAGLQQALSAAIDEARDRGDWVAVAQAATSFRSSGVWYWREMGYEDTHTVQALEQSLEHIDEPALQARLWANLGMERYGVYRSADANACGERSLELARRSGDPETLLVCLSARAIVLWMPGAARQHEAAAREMLALPLRPEDEIAAWFHLAVALHHQNRAPEADAAMAVAFERAARLRHTNCDVPLAWWKWMRADETMSPDASRLGAETLRLHRRTTMMSLREGAGLILLRELPRSEPVPADVARFALGHPQYGVRAVTGYHLVLRGQVAEGLETIGPLPPPEEYDYSSHAAACLHAEALGLAGRRDELAEVLSRIQPNADETATFGSVASFGSTALYVGRACAVLGRVAEARAYLEQAVADNERAGSLRFLEPSRRALADLGPEGTSAGKAGGKPGGKPTVRPR